MWLVMKINASVFHQVAALFWSWCLRVKENHANFRNKGGSGKEF